MLPTHPALLCGALLGPQRLSKRREGGGAKAGAGGSRGVRPRLMLIWV